MQQRGQSDMTKMEFKYLIMEKVLTGISDSATSKRSDRKPIEDENKRSFRI
jgi:hypothetical protein